MIDKLTRRELLSAGALLGTAGLLGRAAAAPEPATAMTITLNTSTIRPTELEEKIRIAAEVGYDGIELWANELQEHVDAGKSLEDLAKMISDLGLFVPNVIGLWDSMPASTEDWEASLEGTRQRMEHAQAVGSLHVAALPTPDRENIDLKWCADRYRDLLGMGEEIGIVPAVEFVGFFKGVHRLGQAMAILLDANHASARLVCDTFHLYRGGSGYEGVRHLNGASFAICHFNDVPDTPAQTELGDEHRIYPGDGILPLVDFVRNLASIGFAGPLSIEMFNRDHWQQDPREVARTALEKTRAIVEEALA